MHAGACTDTHTHADTHMRRHTHTRRQTDTHIHSRRDTHAHAHTVHQSDFPKPTERFLPTQSSNLLASFRFEWWINHRSPWSRYKPCYCLLMYCMMCMDDVSSLLACKINVGDHWLMMKRNYSTQCPSHNMHG